MDSINMDDYKEIFVSWVARSCDTFARPAFMFVACCLLYNLPLLADRVRLTVRGVAYLLFCHDKSWKKPKDPMAVFTPVLSSEDGKRRIEKKTIVFIRHGESTWNDTFNKGTHRSAIVFVLGFIPGLIKSVLYELYLVLSGKVDSWFYDSPLSHLGLSQVDELGQFLSKKPGSPGAKKMTPTEAKYVSILRGDPGAAKSTLLCSSLRRALSTMAASFRERLARRPGDKILVVPSLQEISRNPDTLSITLPRHQVTASWIDQSSDVCDFQGIFTNQTDMRLHKGNKPIRTNGLLRMNEFCDFAFKNVKEDVIIVGGHSIYFRSFFRTYLPYSSDHVSKKKKVQNAGCVAFTLLKAPTASGDVYMIDPKSIEVIYRGF